MSRFVEVAANAVALFRLPMPLEGLANVIKQLETSYGPHLRMTEQPKGWLQFFEPETESEVKS